MRRRNLWIGGAVLLVALVAVGPCLLPRPPITAAFQTAKVSRGALEATVSASAGR